MRKLIHLQATGIIAAVGVLIASVSFAQATSFNLPAQPLADSLRTVAGQTNSNILFDLKQVGSFSAKALNAQMTQVEALTELLKGTGLTFEYLDEKTVRVGKARMRTSSAGDRAVAESEGGALQLAQSNASAPAAIDFSPSKEEGISEDKLSEVIVTAQKKVEREQDVPIAMTVINPDELAQNGQARIIDYYNTVPGLSVNSGGFVPGQQYITIRGLSAGMNQNATTATVIDDVPTGTGTNLEFGNLTSPDIDPSDLARIEVLKGPQGTLYGADSLGGLIKYVTVDPSTEKLSGRIEVSGADVPAGGAGYTVRGAVNIPLSDTLAIRASGFSRHDPGYVDDITSEQTNVNSANVYGGRLSAMWRPSADVSLKVSALVQDTRADGSAYFDAQTAPNGTLQPTYGYLKMTGEGFDNPFQTQEQLYSAIFHAKVAGVDLVSVSGYSVNVLHSAQDYGTTFGGQFFASPVNFNVLDTAAVQSNKTDKLSQELRLSGSAGKRLDWLVGGFYSYETDPAGSSAAAFYSANPVTGVPVELLDNSVQTPYSFYEEAAFGDVTLHIADRFDVQLGGRESWNRIKYGGTLYGPGVLDLEDSSSPFEEPLEHSTGQAFTYLVTPQFKLSTDAMVYARVASGYRIGGPNEAAQFVPSIPVDYKPDRTVNYEIGTKDEFLDHRLSIDASIYYINWHDFQLSVFNFDQVFDVNAGNAKSEGVELAVRSRPMEGLSVTAQGSFNEAELTQALPPAAVMLGTYGVAGDPLPYSIRWSGGIAANQDFPLLDDWQGFLGGQFTYVSARPGEFASAAPSPTTPPRALLPSYTTLNLHAGARYDLWLVNLYVNNVADRRSVVGATPYVGSVGVTGGYYGAIIQPRTIGLSVSRIF